MLADQSHQITNLKQTVSRLQEELEGVSEAKQKTREFYEDKL